MQKIDNHNIMKISCICLPTDPTPIDKALQRYKASSVAQRETFKGRR